MRKEVEEFLERNRLEQEKEAHEKRAAYLIGLGLYGKEYPQEGESTEAYPDFDEELEKSCRKIPLELSEEEYAAVCAASPYVEKKKGWPIWPVYQILFVLALSVYAVGLLSYVSLLESAIASGEFSLTLLLTYSVIGSILLALSEVVRLMKKRVGEQ